jgi:hypothetical protein
LVRFSEWGIWLQYAHIILRGDPNHDRVKIQIQYIISGTEESEPQFIETSVGQNLGLALYHLRGNNPLVLWTDAICIDQENENEKTDQVQLMFEIYKRSVETIVWLGPSGNHTRVAVNTVKEIGAHFSKYYFGDFPELSIRSSASPEPRNDGVNQPDLLFRSLKSLLNCNNPSDDTGQSLNQFFTSLSEHIAKAGQDEVSPILIGLRDIWTRAWWHRIWVIQEYVSARRIRFFCGYGHVTSEEMWLTATLYRAYADNFINQTLAAKNQQYLPAFTTYDYPKMIDFRHGRKNQVLGCSLDSILRTVHGLVQLQSPSDPRDNVYSLLGLAADTLGIIPDYSKNLKDVFFEVTRQIVLGKEGTRALVLCNPPKSLPDLPSFVIDWQTIGDNLFYYLKHAGLHCFERSVDVKFCSTRTNHCGLGAWHLHLTGATLGIVQSVTISLGNVEQQVRHDLREEMEEYDFKARLWQEWIRVHYNFFRDLLQDIPSLDAIVATEDIVAIFANSMGITNRPELRNAVATALQAEPEQAIQSWSHRVWLSRIDILYRHRSPEARLFATANGSFGHVTAPVQPTDHLVVFYGCSIPFIIREKEHRTYQIVGPCVLPQLLKGEAPSAGLGAEEFVLI